METLVDSEGHLTPQSLGGGPYPVGRSDGPDRTPLTTTSLRFRPRKRSPIGKTLLVLALGFICSVSAFADEGEQGRDAACNIPASVVNHVQSQLATVVQLNNGAIFGQIFPGPNRMWSAVVDRQGRLCSVIVTGDGWPDSRAIAIAKANTANGFSNDALALSTANLYSATQPGGSLYGLNNSNPFNPDFLRQGTSIGGSRAASSRSEKECHSTRGG